MTSYVEGIGTWVHLHPNPGLNVLYGLNGAGKTRILNSIPDASFRVAAPLRPDTPDELSATWWGSRAEWGYTHENELKWDAKDFQYEPVLQEIVFDVDALTEAVENMLTEKFLGPGRSTRECREITYRSTTALLLSDWMNRIAYWPGNWSGNDDEARRFLLPAVYEFLTNCELEISQIQGTEPAAWEIRYLALISPDTPAILNYLDFASDRLMSRLSEGDFERIKNEIIPHDEDAAGEIITLLYDLDCHSFLRNDVFEFVLWKVSDGKFGYNPWRISELRSEVCSRNHRGGKGWSPFQIMGDPNASIEADTFSYLQDNYAERCRQLDARAIESKEYSFEKYSGEFVRWTPSFPNVPPNHPDRFLARHAAREQRSDRAMFADHLIRPPSPENQKALDDVMKQASSRATDLYRRFLPSAGDLRVSISDPSSWGSSALLIWQSKDTSGAWVPITELSETQQRLALLSIRFALPSSFSGIPVLILDEPERGLHRLAELHLHKGLLDLCAEFDPVYVFVATHSPAFLRPDNAHLNHVQRVQNGRIEVNKIDSLQDLSARKLGLNPTDLLQLVRSIVLVEGTHDEWVLEALFKEEFGRMGVKVMSMRGASKLISAAEGQLLFDFSDANLVVMLDNLSNEIANSKWNEAIVRHQEGAGVAEIVQILDGLTGSGKAPGANLKRKTEAEALKDFCVSAITHNRHDRITFSMLQRGDIEFYLDPKYFLTSPGGTNSAVTWEELRSEHEAAKKKDGVGNFKKWLQDTGRAKFGERRRWDNAVAALDEIPADFLEVYRTIERVHLLTK